MMVGQAGRARARRPHGRAAMLVLCLAAVLLPAGGPVGGAGAQPGPAPASGVPLKPDWQRYVLAPPTRQVPPAAVLATSGDVANATAALTQGGGAARLTRRTTGDEAVLDLDFGKVVAGRLEIGFAAASDPPPGVRVAFSESRQYLGPRSDFSRSDYVERGVQGPGTDNHVPNPRGEVWVDRTGCQFERRVCADGLRAFRYVRIYLGTAPGDEGRAAATGWAEIDWVRLNFTALLGTPDTFKGWFLSSDDRLNRIWYASVYTNELTTSIFDRDDVDPREGGTWTPELQGKLVHHDGAKRDRAPWIGDLAVQGPVEMVSHADPVPIANVLADLASHQGGNGFIPPSPFQAYNVQIFEYPAWWVVTLHEYALYSGDLALAERLWPNVMKLLDGWYPSQTNERGLLDKSAATFTAGYGDYAFLPRGGEVGYYNALYVRALVAAAALADALGRPEGPPWRARAERVAVAIDDYLWDPTVGAYLDATNGPPRHPQDANAHALLAFAPRLGRTDAALDYLGAANRRPWGNAFVDNDSWFAGASGRVYGFLSYPEVLARFAAGRDEEALEQIRRTWGWMLDRDPNSTVWEAIGPAGDIASYQGAYSSLAHGWAAGAAPALTNRLLGVAPTAPGFARYDLVPHPGDVAWAQGRVPTPHGPLDAAWERPASGSFSLRFSAPPGTIGRIGVPTAGRTIAVSLDGVAIWDGAGPTAAITSGIAAHTDGAYVFLEGVPPGAHLVEGAAAAESREGQCFAETGKCLRGPFLAHWQAHGGLAVNGFPLTAERVERLEDGKLYRVQWFERARFELHPENAPPNDLLLGQFGRRVRRADPPAPPQAGATYFPETGHNLGGRFRDYWEANGGLPQFGYPLGDPFVERLEDGKEYTVQYFERARFEHHPENSAPNDVLLGQFGRRILVEPRR